MKFNLKSIFAAVLALAATACSQPAIDDLTGTFAEPTILDLEGAKAEIAVDKQEGFRFITVTLSGKDQVVVKFASKDYFLTPTTYEICNAADAKAGRYIQGVSTANGKAFTFGGITVENLAIDGITYTYKIASTVQTGENERVRFAWTGTINFEPDPEPVKLTQVFSASSNVANGTNSVTLNLGSAGVTSTYDAATWSTVYSGNGNFAAIDIYSADGYLHEGTYKACAAGGVIAEGEFGIGWDPGDLWGIGMIFENWGTCWWTVDGGNTSAQKITNGEIVVSKKGSKWVIEYNNYAANGIWFVFEGKIDELTEPAVGPGSGEDYSDAINLVSVLSAQSNVANGTKSITLNLASEGVSSEYDAATWSTKYIGTGYYAAIDIYSEDGYLRAGTYKACATGGAIAEGEFGIGWDPGDLWGIGMVFENWGTCWWTVTDGVTSAEKITEGEIVVKKKGGKWVIDYKTDALFFHFLGDIEAVTDPAEDWTDTPEGPADEPDYEILTHVLSAQSNVANGTKSVTLNIASESVSSEYDAATWSTKYIGTGYYAAMDIYSEEGTLAEGTYKACATGGAIAEGEFGIGWDPGDLWGIGMVFENWGTCWWTVTDGVTSAEKITDGTITVSKSGDNYTITYVGESLAFKYEGPIAL